MRRLIKGCKVAASLRILGEKLEPSQVEAILQLEATESHRAGDPRVGPTGRIYAPYREGGWTRRFESTDPSLREALETLLLDLEGRGAALARLRDLDLYTDIFVGLFEPSASIRFELDPDLLGTIAGLGLFLRIDAYVDAADGEREGDALPYLGSRAVAALRVSGGKELEPSLVGEMLQLTATESHRAGDPRLDLKGNRHPPHEEGLWSRKERGADPSPDEVLQRLLKDLHGRGAALARLRELGFQVDLFVSLFGRSQNIDFVLDPSSLGGLTELSLSMSMAIQAFPEEDEF
jgi:Domain of unknown function (DUF4279)